MDAFDRILLCMAFSLFLRLLLGELLFEPAAQKLGQGVVIVDRTAKHKRAVNQRADCMLLQIRCSVILTADDAPFIDRRHKRAVKHRKHLGCRGRNDHKNRAVIRIRDPESEIRYRKLDYTAPRIGGKHLLYLATQKIPLCAYVLNYL